MDTGTTDRGGAPEHQSTRTSTGGKTLRLFADDPEIQGWRYGAMVTSLVLPAL